MNGYRFKVPNRRLNDHIRTQGGSSKPKSHHNCAQGITYSRRRSQRKEVDNGEIWKLALGALTLTRRILMIPVLVPSITSF